jgi:hypothetical protein
MPNKKLAKSVEENGHSIMKVLFPYLPAETDKHHEPQLG